MTAKEARKRPMAKVHRPALFGRLLRETLSLAALELLLDQGTALHEGQALSDGHYFGSAMITIDVGATMPGSDPAAMQHKEAAAAKLARLIGNDTAAQRLIQTRAETGAVKQAGRELLSRELDLRVRAEGPRVLIDVDVEARLHPRAVGGETVA